MKYTKLINRLEIPEAKVFPIQPPVIHPKVVPKGENAPVLAMDSYDYMQEVYSGQGFPGYSYLSQLATRAEYRAFAAALSTELTRKGIEFTSKQDDDDDERIAQIEKEFKRLGVMSVMSRAAGHDSFFGSAHIFLDIKGHDIASPLIISNKTIERGSLKRITTVEPIWATPSAYNSNDPTRPDFFKPTEWFMLGKRIHASRLCTVITRELPDILKPAFNFGGMSLSQLAEPYVDNWLRTRQSVSDLINNFSITVLATSMDQVLQGDDSEADQNLIDRATLFTKLRSNKGLMLVDKEREEIVQVNTPLSGLHELQAQSQEHMCSVSRIPTIILTGISPSGLNASSDGEIRVFYDWIAAQQEAYWREPLELILNVVQLSLFGEIDPDINFRFVPLYQLTETEEADNRLKDAQAAGIQIDHGVIDPQEERERLARNDNSGYAGLDLTKEIVQPMSEPVMDSDFKESEHPRDSDGKFSSGSGGNATNKPTPKQISDWESDPNVMELYHGGDDPIDQLDRRGPYRSVFSTSDLSAAESHGDNVSKFFVPKDKIISGWLDADKGYEDTKSALEKSLEESPYATNYLDFDDIYNIVVYEDEGSLTDDLRQNDDLLLELQALRADVAKELGYYAVSVTDEHGTSYQLLDSLNVKAS